MKIYNLLETSRFTNTYFKIVKAEMNVVLCGTMREMKRAKLLRSEPN